MLLDPIKELMSLPNDSKMGRTVELDCKQVETTHNNVGSPNGKRSLMKNAGCVQARKAWHSSQSPASSQCHSCCAGLGGANRL